MKYAGLSDIGTCREENQDIFSITPLSDKACLIVVCDGMGGVRGGKIAATHATSIFVSTALALIEEKKPSLNDFDESNLQLLETILKESTQTANRAVYQLAQSTPELTGMGSTLLSCLVIGHECLICNVGDSRLYRISKYAISQITRDHSYVQMLIDTGMISPKEAKNHPDRNIIMRAIGTRPIVTAETFHITVDPNETLLLCSDGLYGYVSPETIFSILWGSDELFQMPEETKVKALIDAANRIGGRDNITAVTISFIS